MRVLVTGGAGFIGSHVSERLLRDGHSVSIIDDLNDYYAPTLKRNNLETIARSGSFDFFKGDIVDEIFVSKVFESVRPDAVIHLAARAGVRPSLEKPALYARVNVEGTTNLLEASRQFGVPKFIFASSSSIYGLANQVPFREDDTCNLPVSPYAATKIAGEKIAYAYSHLYGIGVICLRLFTVYGPRQRPDLAIRKFFSLIEDGQYVPVFGDGETGRDYTFVEDTVDGITRAMAHDAAFDVFNLGNSHPIRLIELIRTIEKVLGKSAKLQWMEQQPGDVSITYADISKAQRILDYRPKTSFVDGIEKFFEWNRQQNEWRKPSKAAVPALRSLPA